MYVFKRHFSFTDIALGFPPFDVLCFLVKIFGKKTSPCNFRNFLNDNNSGRVVKKEFVKKV
jgi:hypothetical protein